MVQNIVLASHPYTSIEAVQYADGGALVARYQGEDLVVERVEPGATVSWQCTLPGRMDGKLVSLQDLAADTQGNVYLLLERKDPLTGEALSQEIRVWRPDRLLFQEVSAHTLDAGESGVRWQWLSVTSSVSVIGTTPTAGSWCGMSTSPPP